MNLQDIVSGFTKCIIGEASLEGMLECLAEMAGSIAVFEDQKLLTLSASTAGKEKFEAPGQYLSLKSSNGFKGTDALPHSIADEYENTTINRLVAAVSDGAEPLGFLSLLRENAPFEEEALFILKIASDFFALQAVLERKLARIELKFMGNFVEDLIFSGNLDHDSIMNRAKALNYSISQPHRVLVAESQTMRKQSGYGAELVKIAQAGLNRHSGGLAMYKNNELIILYRQEPDGEAWEPAKQLAEEIVEEASSVLKIKLCVGIGNVCAALEDYKNSYLTAKKTLEIGEFMITEGQIRSFEQFKVHALFLSTIKPQELQKYAKSQLSKLLEYDRIHKTEFLKTLQEFLYLRNNIEGTAKSISMSVSGLKYRLKKIEQILGVDLKDNKESFDLQLALIILQLFGEYRI